MIARHLFLGSVLVATAPSAALARQTTEPETVLAERGAFAVMLELAGTFDAPNATEVAYRPAVYAGELEVAEVVAPGPVSKGQLLVRFRSDKIDEQIAQAEIDLKIARANLQRSSEEMKRKGEAAAIQLESARMDHHNADVALKTYREVEMPIRIAEAELDLQSSKDSLKEEEEQFAQLQKMYTSDDLVEATEEIVLNRSKRSLERGRKQLEFTQRRHELLTSVDIPRELSQRELALRKAANDWELVQATVKLQTEQSASELEKAQAALARQEQSLAKLRSDRDALTLKSPEGGTAIPGQLVAGKWVGLEEAARALRTGEKARPNQVLFTIVQPGPRAVHTLVPEASLLDVREGLAGTVVPTASPKSLLAARVTRVARVATDGQFHAWLEAADSDPRLLAGNACKIQLKTSEIADAISVPSGTIAQDGERRIVHLWQGGAVQKREVTVGATSQGRTVITSGLDAGERVLRSAPKESKPE